MSLPDIIILVLLLVFAFSGVKRGIVWELFTILGMLLGLGFLYYYRLDLMALVERLFRPGWEQRWGGGVLFLGLFMLVYLGFSAIGRRLHEAMKETILKWPDRILGAAAGVLKGAILIGALVWAIQKFDGPGYANSFLRQSEFIRWGKRLVIEIIYWESPERRKWVSAEMIEQPAASALLCGKEC